MSRLIELLGLLIGAIIGAFLGFKFDTVASISILTTFGFSTIPGAFVWGSIGALLGDKIGVEIGTDTITRKIEFIFSFIGIIFGIVTGIIAAKYLSTDEIKAGIIFGKMGIFTGMIPFVISGGIIGGIGGNKIGTEVDRKSTREFDALQAEKVEMNYMMQRKCRKIIHAASIAAAAAASGLAQLPGSDNAALVPIQVAMIISLGNVFNKSISEDIASYLLCQVVVTNTGKYIARTATQFLVGWIPGAGNVVNATTAAALTEAVGWGTVKYFRGGA